MALLHVFPQDHTVVAHELTAAPSTLEWWQQNNHLLGVGFAHSPEEATERAIAMADRGDFARRNVTTWFHRGLRKFRFFRRSNRDPEDHYMPRGRELTAEEFRFIST